MNPNYEMSHMRTVLGKPPFSLVSQSLPYSLPDSRGHNSRKQTESRSCRMSVRWPGFSLDPRTHLGTVEEQCLDTTLLWGTVEIYVCFIKGNMFVGTSEPKMQKTKRESKKQREANPCVWRTLGEIGAKFSPELWIRKAVEWHTSKDMGRATGSQKMLTITNLSWDICTLVETSLP